MATYAVVPDYIERKGSLFMRSDHMNYSRATLNSNWHQAREAEPKEYDINNAPTRDLCVATYARIGDVTEGNLPDTTYQDFCEQINLKDKFEAREEKKPMINEDTVTHTDLDRETGSPERGSGSVLSRHHPEYNKCHFDTTHLSDYKPPFPYTPAEEKPQEFADYTQAYKKCHSQFTDTVNHRRSGRNTWQDESGLYNNSHFKIECPNYKKENPITKAFLDVE